MTRTPLLLAAALMALAGAASAQPLDLRLRDVSSAPVAPAPLQSKIAAPAPDLADPLDGLAPTAIQARTLSTAVFAKTAVEHRFDKRDDLTGSVGFLCGLQPGHTGNGAAAAYGSDPHGRFVGAKFSIAFR